MHTSPVQCRHRSQPIRRRQLLEAQVVSDGDAARALNNAEYSLLPCQPSRPPAQYRLGEAVLGVPREYPVSTQ